jgi:hypothetical protein
MSQTWALAAVVVAAAALPSFLLSASPAHRLRLWTFDFYSTHTAVSVEVEPNGIVSFSTAGPKVEMKRTLRPEEVAELIRVIEEGGFFGLESEYGTCYIEGLAREIRVELDGKKKRVGLCSISVQLVPESRRPGAIAAWRVWNAARMLFPEHYPEHSRHDADDLILLVRP